MKQRLSYFSLCLFFSKRCTTLSFNPPHSHARCTTLHTFAHTFVALFPLCSWALMLCWYSSNLFLFFSYTLISLTDVRNAVGWMLGLGREPECRSRPFLYLFLFGYSRRAGSVRILVIRVWKHWNCGDIWNSILRVKPFRPSLFFPSRHWHYQLLLRGFIFSLLFHSLRSDDGALRWFVHFFFFLFQSRACCWGPRFPPQSYHFGVARATLHPRKTALLNNLHLNFAKFRFFTVCPAFVKADEIFCLFL